MLRLARPGRSWALVWDELGLARIVHTGCGALWRSLHVDQPLRQQGCGCWEADMAIAKRWWVASWLRCGSNKLSDTTFRVAAGGILPVASDIQAPLHLNQESWKWVKDSGGANRTR